MGEYPAIEKLAEMPTAQEICRTIADANWENVDSLDRVYVFGAGGTGERIKAQCQAAGHTVVGFVDNSTDKQRDGWGETPVFSPLEAAADSDATIIISSVLYFSQMERQLDTLGAKRVVFYPILAVVNSEAFTPDAVFSGMQQDLAENAEAYLALFDRLGDDTSRRVYDALLHFRLTLDTEHCRAALTKGHPHYFPPDVIELGPDEVFVDGGGYTGDTSASFIEVTGERFRKIYLFEPDPELMNQAKSNLSGQPNVVYVDRALYDSETVLRFEPGGLAGAISDSGSISVHTTTIDRAVSEPATYIKLDVEGAEPEALRGATSQITEHRPRLAVSVYHHPAHLRQLPQQIDQLRPDYRVFMRHYSVGVADTVYYCT